MVDTFTHVEARYGGVEAYVLGGGMAKQQIASLRQAIVE
jgi:hypothetical protein